MFAELRPQAGILLTVTPTESSLFPQVVNWLARHLWSVIMSFGESGSAGISDVAAKTAALAAIAEAAAEFGGVVLLHYVEDTVRHRVG
jgi:hypothetical protein